VVQRGQLKRGQTTVKPPEIPHVVRFQFASDQKKVAKVATRSSLEDGIQATEQRLATLVKIKNGDPITSGAHEQLLGFLPFKEDPAINGFKLILPNTPKLNT